jgi:argininosuccinate lyase
MAENIKMYYCQYTPLLQIAMHLFGMWFSAYAETLIDDITMLNAALKIVDQNPLSQPLQAVPLLIEHLQHKNWF